MAALKLDTIPERIPAAGADGPWQLAMSTSGSLYLGASLTDLVAALIEDYPVDGTETEQFLSRMRAAIGFAETVQGLRLAEKSSLGAFAPHGMSPQEVAIALEDKKAPVGTEGKWRNNDVPLLVMASHYEPYTCLTAPTGNILSIDPYTELTLLESLSDAKYIELYEV
ncbi:hypothetical protein LG293_16190 (plasmid) [Citricoccus nitrophenolicus]